MPAHTSAAQLAWVTTAFVLPTAVLELNFGVVGDLFGRRRLLVGGAASFPWSVLHSHHSSLGCAAPTRIGSTRTCYSFCMEQGSVSWEAPDGEHPARRAAQRSMNAVAARHKDEWLSLFAEDAVVKDPVGPSMLDPEGAGHRGRDGISSFWDQNFGAVKRFRFRISDSFANGPSCANVTAIEMDLGGASMTVDCLVVYTVNDSGLITSLLGYWEPDRAMATLSTR
ncbi:MAG: nuclear transport factor 2 family protein [Streptosporangiaceae bacterium]